MSAPSRKLSHDLRERLHYLRLCLSVSEAAWQDGDFDDARSWLVDMNQAADQLDELLIRLDTELGESVE